MNLRIIFSLVLTAIFMITANNMFAQKADYVYKNGAIYTMDTQNPQAEAIAISGKNITYVGNNKGVEDFIGNDTKVIDLKGQMLLPGFVESHIHTTLSIMATGADLQTNSMDELLARVKAFADAHPDDKVIRGFGWRYTMFPTTGPTKEVLDKVFPDRAVMLVGIDCHSAWVNSKALQMAGIDAKHPDPSPGLSYYQRDPKTNEPTGWVVETMAEQEILSKLEPMSPESVMKATEELFPQFSAVGITSVFDAGIGTMPTETALELLQKMEKNNHLPVRVVASYYWNTANITDPVERTLALKKKFNSELVQLNTLKIMFDGGEAQHTAVMLQEYADQPGFFAEYQINKKIVADAIMKAQQNNLNTHAHCYGDETVRSYLDAIEEAEKMYPNSISRHAAAHVIFLSDADVPRFAKLNVTMQSSIQWATPDPTILRSSEIVGKDLAFKELFRVNSILKTGGRIAFGSDWPASGYVSTYHPLDAIQVAITRAALSKYGMEEFMPVLPPFDEIITLDQALEASTLGSAYVLGLEDKIGSLKVGKLADIVVLEKDLHKIKPTEISTTKVMMTMMNGKITFQNK